jgi:hypothetical protein
LFGFDDTIVKYLMFAWWFKLSSSPQSRYIISALKQPEI